MKISPPDEQPQRVYGRRDREDKRDMRRLAKVSSLAPFIMPERLAKTDPYAQVTEMVPFKFVKEEHQPGNKVVYVKNTDYVPRSEPSDWASGGKVIKVDRVEWVVVPDIRRRQEQLGGRKPPRPPPTEQDNPQNSGT